MSGLPGRSLLCNRNRYPSLCNALLTASSGFVFFDDIRDITSERFAFEKTSVMEGLAFGCAVRLRRAPALNIDA